MGGEAYAENFTLGSALCVQVLQILRVLWQWMA